MAEVAAHLVDRVLPTVPMRQWVLSRPVSLRYRIAYDGALLTPILDAFIRALFASLRRVVPAHDTACVVPSAAPSRSSSASAARSI